MCGVLLSHAVNESVFIISGCEIFNFIACKSDCIAFTADCNVLSPVTADFSARIAQCRNSSIFAGSLFITIFRMSGRRPLIPTARRVCSEICLCVAVWARRVKYSLTFSHGPCIICEINKSNMRSFSVIFFKNAALNRCKLFVISGARVAYQIAASSDNWNAMTLTTLSLGTS